MWQNEAPGQPAHASLNQESFGGMAWEKSGFFQYQSHENKAIWPFKFSFSLAFKKGL